MTDEIAPEVAETSPSEDANSQDSSPAPEKTVEASPESPPESDTPEVERKPRAQERIEQLSAEKKAALEAAEYWRNKALETPKEEPKDDPRPTLEGFEFDPDKFAEASASWMEREVGRQTTAKVAAALEGNVAKSEQDAIRAQWLEKSEKFQADHSDYDEIALNPTLPLTAETFSAIQESDMGPEIVYHLGKNVDLAARIARMTPARQAAAIGRLEAELSKPAPKPQPSKAPEPPTSVEGGTPTADISKLPIKDWMKAEKERLWAKRSR